MAYDIAEVFEEIEMALIKSMRNNMKRHINEEYEYGLNWTQWQAEMLSGLSQYRAENKELLKGYMGRINAEIDAAIREAYATGESEQEIELLKAIKRGYKPPKSGKSINVQGGFFRTNARKLNALIKATTDDMKKAETAMLRMTDDVYRKTMFKAQMFYNTGAGSMWQCVDMATKDFLSAGINCVQYKNGARVNIASYAEMSLRTANKRANLMGQAMTREKWGIHTVKVNARGTACPMCMPYLGKVFVDDVYGEGTAAESRATGYPLLSSAVANGLFHPNCKDACSTYYEGINREPQELTQDQEDEIKRRYNLEQEQRYYERNYKRNMRLGNGCLDQTSAQKYFGRASEYKKKLIDLCDAHPDVLRLDKQRLSLRGVLSVDNAGKITISAPLTPSKTLKPTNITNQTIKLLDSGGIEYLPVQKLKGELTDDVIIQMLGGGDETDGSCASLALAYIGRKYGYDVLDFRDGNSRVFFSGKLNKLEMFRSLGVDTITENSFKTNLSNGKKILSRLKKGREYYLSVGRHAAIVRYTDDGILQYLELQSKSKNGWRDFGDVSYTLRHRFGCSSSSRSYSFAHITDIEQLKDNKEFKDILGYINTELDNQKKGASGHVK